MPDIIRNSINAFFNVLKSIQIIDVIDIIFLTYIVYAALKLVRETRAGQLVKGILLLVGVRLLSGVAHLKTLSWLSENALKAGAVAIVILFQPELRRMLERFGQTTNRLSRMAIGENNDVVKKWENAIPIICDAAEQLSNTCTGALIVIERSTRLGEQIMNGTVLKAEPSRELFGTIFWLKTPLHDGAVIMREGIIWAAACFLPKPQKEELIDKHLGSRHRAAIGMSENSDALVIVVSEETGQISVAQNGSIQRDYTRASLEELLRKTLIPPEKESWRTKTLRLPFLRSKSKSASCQTEPEQEPISKMPEVGQAVQEPAAEQEKGE